MCSTAQGKELQNCPVKCPKDLTKKIFVKDSQNCRLLFTLGKTGEPLWRNATPGDVLDYNPFFDPCLKNFFRRRGIRNHLLKSNMVTDKNEILCSLKDYNEYRQSLHRVHADHERARMSAQDFKEKLQKRLKISELVYKKIEAKNRKFTNTYGEREIDPSDKCLKVNPIKYETLVRNLKGKKSERECKQRKKYLMDVKKYEERLKKIQQDNYIKRNELLERGLYRNLEIIKKQIFVIEKQRERESKINKKICERFKGLQNKKVPKRSDEQIVIVKCPHYE